MFGDSHVRQILKCIKKYEHNIVPNNLKAFCEFAGLSKEEFLENIEHLRDMSMWKKNGNNEWEILDWIGNHVHDDGIDDVRLPIKEKLEKIISPDYSKGHAFRDEGLIFL